MKKKHGKFNTVDRLIITYTILVALLGLFTLFSDYDYFDEETALIKQMASVLFIFFIISYYVLLSRLENKANSGIGLKLHLLSQYFLLTILNIYIGWAICLRIVNTYSFNPNMIMAYLPFALIAINIFSFSYYITELKKRLSRERIDTFSSIIIIIILIQLVIFFAIVYANLFDIDRTSFQGVTREYPVRLFIDFLYFSTVTFTTLGFGDITPISSAAKIVVMIEVLLFVVYISIILLTLANSRKHEKSSEVNSKDKDESDSNSLEGESIENDK